MLSVAHSSTPTDFLAIYTDCKVAGQHDCLAEAFLRKCCNSSDTSVDAAVEFADRYNLAPDYFRCIATLGKLFRTNPRTSLQERTRVSLVNWLLDRDPSDMILLHPATYSFFRPWRDEVLGVWKGVLSNRTQNVLVLKNAATFFLSFEPKLSRQCLARCSELEPNNPYWEQLYDLYFPDGEP